jgi:predicted nuclease of predicted toxin-antitoxin system
MRFKIDENLPEEFAQLLRANGWDCLSVVDQALGGADDPRINEVCRLEGRILITFDLGFANILAYPPASHPGFVVLRLRRQDKPHVLDVGVRLVARLRARELRSELWIVEEGGVRIRG